MSEDANDLGEPHVDVVGAIDCLGDVQPLRLNKDGLVMCLCPNCEKTFEIEKGSFAKVLIDC